MNLNLKESERSCPMEFYKLVQVLYLKGVHVVVLPLRECPVSFVQVSKLLILSDELNDKARIYVLKEFLSNYE